MSSTRTGPNKPEGLEPILSGHIRLNLTTDICHRGAEEDLRASGAELNPIGLRLVDLR